MNQKLYFQNNVAIQHVFFFLFFFKKVLINFSMAHSRFVNTFSRISKYYVFRIQIFCHIDLVSFCFRCGMGCGGRGARGGGKGASGTLSSDNVLIQK